MHNSFLLAGLGNPGRGYTLTRHNFGFILIDYLASKYGIDIKHRGFTALYGEGRITEQKVILLKPQTYMNLSGQAIQKALNFYKLPLEKLLVICDDFNLDFGTVRFRLKGTAGGQKGLESIIQVLKSNDFARLRLGIGPVPELMDNSDFVLSPFGKEEKKTLPQICEVGEQKILEFLQMKTKIPEITNQD
jgi:peptidyl-tRNA hydrolase, PTH1 family